jgi:hypothetical protein
MNKIPKIIVIDCDTYIEVLDFKTFENNRDNKIEKRVQIYGILKKQDEEPEDPYLQTR